MTTALVVSPQRYVELLRDGEEFRHKGYDPEGDSASQSFVGIRFKGNQRVYINTRLVRNGETEREANEERLLLALSLEDRPPLEADEVAYWTARINLMGWTITERYEPALYAYVYEARRGQEKRTEVGFTLSRESAREDRVLGAVARKMAYAVWRLWAPEFIWPEDA